MTFQQLEYIAAVDQYRHFVNAATACGVTQSTLSTTIAKLEQEIDVIIFDRSKHPIEPTRMGQRIIQQAKVILHNSQQLREMVQSEKETDRGHLIIGIEDTVCPYLYPSMAGHMHRLYPGVQTTICESDSETLVGKLQRSEIDMAILPSDGRSQLDLLEIELYTERFMLYTTQGTALWPREWVRPEELHTGDFWSLRNFHDRYPQLSSIVHQESFHTTQLDMGNIMTLISLVDRNGGSTILTEHFRPLLGQQQANGLKPIQGARLFRTVALVIRHDYLRERMLNIVADSVVHALGPDKVNSRLLEHKIKL